jgi:hypothetical protein
LEDSHEGECYSRSIILFGIDFLTVEDVTQLAFESGFCKRKSGKITAPAFLLHFCLEALKGTLSYNDLAAKIQTETGITASRQAYHQRMGDECNNFFMRILEAVMLSKHKTEEVKALIGVKQFSRILVQDSTVIRLPLRLFEIFSGVKNAYKSVCNARIQGTYDLISRRFISFSIDPYTKNDLSVTLDIPVKQGDLVLRDRGYFTIQAMSELKKKGADSIFRYKHKTLFFDTENNEEINLLKCLRKNGSIDKMVLAGKEKNKVRIIAAPVNEEIANIRRMKAKKDSSTKNPSRELLELMNWNIFIITVNAPEITFEIVLKIYGLRWRIENIFRTWKSNFNFDKIHNVSEQQLGALIRARFIMIVLINQHLFNPLLSKIYKISGKHLSMMKFMRYISKNINTISRLSEIRNVSSSALQALIKYCTYDKRKRLNFEQKMEQTIEELNMIEFSLA